MALNSTSADYYDEPDMIIYSRLVSAPIITALYCTCLYFWLRNPAIRQTPFRYMPARWVMGIIVVVSMFFSAITELWETSNIHYFAACEAGYLMMIMWTKMSIVDVSAKVKNPFAGNSHDEMEKALVMLFGLGALYCLLALPLISLAPCHPRLLLATLTCACQPHLP